MVEPGWRMRGAFWAMPAQKSPSGEEGFAPFRRIWIRQHSGSLALPEFFVSGAILRILVPEDRNGEQGRINRAGFANGQRSHRNSAGHLDDREQGIDPFEGF